MAPIRDRVWNEPDGRLRLPWRLVGFLVVFLGLGGTAAQLLPALLEATQDIVIQVWPDAKVVLLVRTVVTLVVQLALFVVPVYLAARFLDRRWFRDLGLRIDRDWWVDLAFGLALGAGLMTGIFLLELLAGWVTIDGLLQTGSPTFSFAPWFVLSVGLWVAVGVYEELFARGYLLTNLAEGLPWFESLGRFGAVVLATLSSSLVFAGLHAANPAAGLASTTGIFLAGIMLAAGYVLTGELAIPIGIHVTWNLFQGTVFGFPVSGWRQRVTLVAIEQRGPSLFTGGSFGPEAGLVGIGATVVGLVLIAVWVRRRRGQLTVAASTTEPDLRPRRDD